MENETRLTTKQLDGLRRLRDHGPEGWCYRLGRAGGAVMRMFDKLVADGYCTKAPHLLTHKGRALEIAGPSRGERMMAEIAAEEVRRHGRRPPMPSKSEETRAAPTSLKGWRRQFRERKGEALRAESQIARGRGRAFRRKIAQEAGNGK